MAMAIETPVQKRDTMPVPDFPPDPAGTKRVARGIIGALAVMPFVQHIAVFGSLAEERADCWSDVDLWVACDDVAQTQWIAASVIRTAFPVLFYRMFSKAAQPSGRYWFTHESPFHKIDISFHAPADYHDLVSQQMYMECPVTTHEVFTRRYPAVSVDLPAPCHPVEISGVEQTIGSRIYFLLSAIKQYARGTEERSLVEERYTALRADMGSLDRSAVMGGGEIGELAYRVIDLALPCLHAAIDEGKRSC